MRHMSDSVEKTTALADKFAKKLFSFGVLRKIGEKSSVLQPFNGATVVGLYGDLGSGKTCFMQGLGLALGISERMVSPTFVIEKIYKIGGGVAGSRPGQPKNSACCFSHLIHIDAYRIEKSEEMLHLGWQEILSEPGNLICIEWPEKIADIMPPDHIKINFTFIDEKTRAIDFENFEI